MRRYQLLAIALTTAGALLAGAAPAAAQCPAFICYLDLQQGGAICPNTSVYTSVRVDPIVSTPPFTDECQLGSWFAAVVRVDLPPGCTGLEITVDYDGEPRGFSINVGDSVTNNGFGGDAGTLPAGQNAELDVLDDELVLWSGATVPVDVVELARQQLALGGDGAMKIAVRDQFVSWSAPYTAAESVDERLFFLPVAPTAPDNRVLFTAFNRTISPVGGPNGSRNGCGVGHVLMFTE